MLGTARLETIINDNSLPAVIEERGQTWVQVRLACTAMLASPADAEHP